MNDKAKIIIDRSNGELDKLYVYVNWFLCPNCGKNDILMDFKYCPQCGMEIEWVGD